MRVKKEINIQIGERIKLAREQSGITQEQMSEQIEVSPQFVSDLERGVVGISITTLKRVCTVLGISSDQILFGLPPKDRTEILLCKCQALTDRQFAILTQIVDKYVEALNTP